MYEVLKRFLIEDAYLISSCAAAGFLSELSKREGRKALHYLVTKIEKLTSWGS